MTNEENVKQEQLNKEIPSIPLLEEALNEEYYKRDYHNAIRSTVYALITVSAIALLIATLILPVIRIYGTSMTPTIADDSIILCRKTDLPERGDILAFYYNNKIVVRRVIALPGDEVSISQSGNVSVNGERLQETYISEKSFGNSDIIYPYTVPEGFYFVLADNRSNGMDSRSSLFGNIKEEDFIGKVNFCVWPFDSFGVIK